MICFYTFYSIIFYHFPKDSRITEIAIDPAAIKECEALMSHATMYNEDPLSALHWVDGVIKSQKVRKHSRHQNF